MSYDFSESLFQPPVDTGPTGAMVQHHQRSLHALVVILSVAVPAIALALYLRNGMGTLTQLVLVLAVLIFFLLALTRSRWAAWTAPILVFSLLLAGAGGVVADGTVRSSALLVILAAVVGGGTYLSHRAMVACGATAVIAVAGLNFVEAEGWLGTPRLSNDGALWMTQIAVIGCLIVMVFYGRRRLEAAFKNQEQALRRWERVASALTASQARFAGLFQHNPAAVLVQSETTGLVLDANEAFVRMFGFTVAQLTGHAPPPIWADADALKILQNDQLENGRIRAKRVRALRCGGKAFDALVYAEFVTQGNERLVITMVLDVSAEAQAHRALEKSEERFSKAFNFSPLGMTITRLSDGLFLEANPANERVLGFSMADFQGKTSIEAGVWVCEEDRAAYIDRLRKDGRLLGYETRMRNKAGDIVEVKIWSESIEIDNEPCNLAFTLNVNEEKRREAMLVNIAKGVSGDTGQAFFRSLVEQLAQAVGAAGAWVAEVGEPGRLASLALVRAGALQENTSVALADTALEQVLEASDLQVAHAKDGATSGLGLTAGSEPDRSFAGVALRDHDGTAIGLLGLSWAAHTEPTPDMRALMTIFSSRCNAELVRLRRDREIQKLQETLEQKVADRTAQLQMLNRELDTFAYSVSHDLKSPLRSIDGFMHMLQEQMQPRALPEDQDLMERVSKSTLRMNHLINDLLALARVSQCRLQRAPVNLGELAAEVIGQERARDLEREVDILIEPGLVVDCDPRMAHIVLENLLGNAWKYSRKRPRAQIQLGRHPPVNGAPPTFFVRDNGAGFDMGRANRLFKPFNRLHGADEFEGTGIGLATVRRIIERHGGSIEAEAQVGQGATFRFSFGHGGG